MKFFISINKQMNINDINNIVIIRFSVRLQHFNFFKNEKERTSWFIFRAKLFNSFLHNCLQVQTKKPNKVYVLVDKDDANLVKQYLNVSNITILYCNNEMKYYKNQIVNDLYKNKLTKNLVISRIDSDDLINKDFFYNMNQQLLIHPAKKLVACRGYLTNLTNIQSLFYTNSPFISECINFETNLSNAEEVKNLLNFSLFDVSHTIHVQSVEHVQNHNAEWIQLIHHTNISNKLLDDTKSTVNNASLYCTPLIPIDHIWFNNWAGFQFSKIEEFCYV